MSAFVYKSTMPASASEVFAWHERPGAFERLTPPWEAVAVEECRGGIRDGARVVLRSRIGPLTQRWCLEHIDYTPGRLFRDVQRSGPFKSWDHRHIFTESGDSVSTLEERIEYTLPLGSLGRAMAEAMVQARLERLFRYRHAVTAGDLKLQMRYREAGKMKVLLTGASGLIGSSLGPLLSTAGHDVVGLPRVSPESGEEGWSPETGAITGSALENAGAVIHLAGENIASGRWTEKRKREIRTSRVTGTRRLAEFLAQHPARPPVFIAASAIGWYGDRGDQWLEESDPAGTGFLAETCRAWEASTQPLVDAGTRVVHMRIGVVLSPRGGALKSMRIPFMAGLGGQIANGRQYMSWISMDDLIGAVYHCLMNDSLAGPVNATSPEPVTNREFTRVLGRVLGRPTVARVPAFAARLALGEMGDELLLASMRVRPSRLLESGYEFRHRELETALRHMLGRPAR